MADISMCQNEKCPLKGKCYRYVAEPDDFHQSYLLISDDKACEYFWKASLSDIEKYEASKINKYQKAFNEILSGYDYYFFINKYGTFEDNTHYEQFKLLYEYFKNDDTATNLLKWIQFNYDFYYKKEYLEENRDPIDYILNKLK